MTPEEARREHHQMLRFMALRFALGLSIGLTCAALVFILNIGHLGTHLMRTDNPIIPVFLIAVPMGLTFGAVALCIAIWMLPYDSKLASDHRDGNDGPPF
jgi:flagellar biosynthesis protein FliR